ncbi:NADP-dependent oxidoreductase [Nocardia takedensis]
MTGTFRTAVVRTPNGPDAIEIIDVPVTEPGPGQIRVAVAGAGVNPVDLGVADGFFHGLGLIRQPEHTGLGWDFSGTVAAVGAGVTQPVGTRVAGIVPGFDRDYGAYAEQLIVPAADVAEVPAALDLVAAASLPLNALAAAQLLDLLGDAPDGGRLLVTGAAGAVGGHLAVLAPARGWRVTGLARAEDEQFVRDLGVEFTTDAEPGFDAVGDAAALQAAALPYVRDGGVLVGVRPNLTPPAERGITVSAVETRPDGSRLADLLNRAATGELRTRVHAILPLDHVAEAHRAVAKGGVRGKYVLRP